MPITLVGSDSQEANRSDTSTLAVPANVQAGDLLVLFAAYDYNSGGTDVDAGPSGWTLQGHTEFAGNDANVWTKVADGTEAGTNVTVTWTRDNGGAISMLRAYRGVDADRITYTGWDADDDDGVGLSTNIVDISVSQGDLVILIGYGGFTLGTIPASGTTYPTADSVLLNTLQSTHVAGIAETLYASAPRSDATITYSYNPVSHNNLYAFAVAAAPLGGTRVRSNVSEDAGSILDAASLNAVDASFSEAFLLDHSYSPTTIKGFEEALAPGVLAASYYPIPRQSTEFLNDYSGETLLSRMARVYPLPIFGKVDDLGLTTFTLSDGDEKDIGQAATAQDVITYVFTQWASEYAWFAYETVPDLRLKVESPTAAGIATPSDYSSDATLGRAYAQVIQFIQDTDNKKTMRQILDELLSPFYGTVVRGNADGRLEIIPVYGPDASNDPVVTLTDKDAYTETTGQPSPTGVINKWTFRSQPYVLTEDGGLLNQSWFQACSNIFPSGSLYATGTGTDISNDDVYIGGGARPNLWAPQSGRIPDGATGIKLTDSGGVKQVTIDYKYNGGSGSVSASDITLTDIPLDGSTVLAIEADGPSIGALHIEISGRYIPESRSVQLWPSGRNDWENANGGHVFRFNLLDATDVWQAESTSVSGTYDLVEEEEDPLPGSPVTASVAAYGTREKTTDITGWGIDSGDQLVRMARAAVFEAVQPKLVRTVEQSVWRAFPVKFSDMGSVIELPSGEQGRLTSRTYSDDFGTNYSQGSLSSVIKVEIIDQNGDGVIDVNTEYYLGDDGEALLLDDGTQMEAS